MSERCSAQEIVMHRIALAVYTTCVIAGPLLSAYSTPGRPATEVQSKADERRGDFDYLLGDWEFTTEHREYGKGRGFWSAVRLAEGQVLDEYRLVGDKSETIYVTTTIRNYNAALKRWELIGMDDGNGLQEFGTARRVGAEMHLEQKFGVGTKEPFTLRIRYFNIQPDRFSWTAARSADGGKTWTEKFIQIEARRIGPARSLGPLAVPKPAPR
jgi:hypothetical protein